ncbi:YfjI family protein [Desulfofundulus salinus]|uniref:YfjI family protein n=1 Tax=Desulfofundulus salinus TaxID=2419843 RepID=UPI000F6513EA|nr:YfjI family protein [Desulfofundulus salinum]
MTTVEDWPDPEPLGTYLLPVEKLPPEIIPEPFRPWVMDVSYRMQCPADFVAVPTIIMTGSIIGTGCGIRPKKYDDWLVVPNLWGGPIARPGKLKTPALAEALKPLVPLEVRARKEYEAAMKEYEADRELFKAQKEALKSKMLEATKGKKKTEGLSLAELRQQYLNLKEPEPPVWRRYRTNDATIEKMSELLSENPRGILLFRDELIGLLAGWDKEGRETDRAFYLEAWNGYGSMTTDRIGRGTIHVDNLCVSILGGIQPAKLLAYLHQAMNELENDGLMQRLQLLVFPDELGDWELVDRYPDKKAQELAFKVIERLDKMDFVAYGARLDEGERIPYFRFDNEAQDLFYEWLTELENEKLRRDDPPALLEHLSKYRSLMPSLALIIHLIDIAAGAAEGDVSLKAAKMAAAWCDYLESHARRIYGLVGSVGQRAAAELAKKIQKRVLKDGFTVRDVYRKGWYLLNSRELVQAACDELVDAGWLKPVPEDVPGRQPKIVYRVNPKIFP